jgi:hypothetical protein
MKGHLDTVCGKCGAPYAWAKINFTRPDGYSDWRLVVYCLCGEADDPEIQAMVHDSYYKQLRDEIWKEQNLVLDQELGKELHKDLMRLTDKNEAFYNSETATVMNPFEKMGIVNPSRIDSQFDLEKYKSKVMEEDKVNHSIR